MTRQGKTGLLIWFVLGLGSELQILASMSMTELFCYIAAPFLFFRQFAQMKRDGLAMLFGLSVLVVVGCGVSCAVNRSPSYAVLRGFATSVLLPCAVIVGHWLIRKNANGFKWFLVGWVLSMFIQTFAFQAASFTSLKGVGSVSASDYAGSVLYWITRGGALATLLSKGWYLHTPLLLDVGLPCAVGVLFAVKSVSGRSAALGIFGFAALAILGGKTQQTMRRIGRHFVLFMMIGLVSIVAAKSLYSYAASRGLLGEDQYKKYEMQTKSGSGLLDLLMGGRKEFFVGLGACLDRPITGFGPWAMDAGGYYARFIMKHGTEEDIASLMKAMRNPSEKAMLLQAHSHLIQFWHWFGLAGLVFWIYVIYVLMRYVKQDCWVVPQWYAWLTCALPALFWNIFFSPFQSRFAVMLLITACLMARAVRKGTFVLPRDMQEEIIENERKRA